MVMPNKDNHAAQVTHEGIIYGNERYSCGRAIKENWYGKAAEHGSWNIKISLETDSKGNLIHLLLEDGTSLPAFKLARVSVLLKSDVYRYQRMLCELKRNSILRRKFRNVFASNKEDL